jgi:hypothetical protein
MTMRQSALSSQLHHVIITGIIQFGAAPSLDELSRALRLTPLEVRAGLAELEQAHGIVLHPGSGEPWVIHPFALSPTATWVESGRGGFWAPCMWCALGITALVGDATIHTRLAGEREPLELHVQAGRANHEKLLVHFARPPREAWANVHHFCAMVLPFRCEADIDAWSARHRLPRGRAVPLPQLAELAARWYGRHADADWLKWTRTEAQSIFHSVGLTDEFWRLVGSDEEASGRF